MYACMYVCMHCMYSMYRLCIVFIVCSVCKVCMYCMPFLRCLARSGKAAKLRWHIHIRISASRCTCGALSYPCWNWQCFSSGVATNSNWVIGAPNCAKHVSIHEIAALSGWSIVRLASQHCSTRMDYGPQCSAHVCVCVCANVAQARPSQSVETPFSAISSILLSISKSWVICAWMKLQLLWYWVSFGARRPCGLGSTRAGG
jgi:hypothetical protein